MNEEAMTKVLDGCLLNDEELESGLTFWESFENPFADVMGVAVEVAIE